LAARGGEQNILPWREENVMKPTVLISMVVLMTIAAITLSETSAADVRITSPANGARIKGPDVTVTIELSDVTLVPPSKAVKKEDLHVIYALDVDTKPFLGGMTKLGSGGDRQHRAGTSATFKDVPPGSHTVQVILVYSDHTPVKPLVAPAVSFVVDK
jgi:hypothetical protein